MVVSSEIDGKRGKRRGKGGGGRGAFATGGGGGGGDGGVGGTLKGEREWRMMRKVLLGIGYWVQGLRCFPWMGVNFFLKDGLRVDPSTLQILQSSANLPMVAKPLIGILSDSFYISGQHRIPYIAIGALFQAVSWLVIAFLSPSSISFFTITIFLFFGNLGASIVEVANDAIVAETAKTNNQGNNNSPSGGEQLQSFVWMASSIGGVLGNLLAGIAIDRFSAQGMFLAFGVILALQLLITVSIHESRLNLPTIPSSLGIKKQLSDLFVVLRRPEIAYSIAWFASSYATIPSLVGTMFFYQTQHLGIDSSALGISKVIGQAAMLLWGVIYNQRLKSIPSRRLIQGIQVALAAFALSDLLFVNGIYRVIGIPDHFYVVMLSGIVEVLIFFKILPFSVLMAKLCPPGCEGSVMAFLMSAVALAMIASGYLGVALASYVRVSGDDFSGLPSALAIQAVCTLLPLIWSSCIPDDKQPKKTKEN